MPVLLPLIIKLIPTILSIVDKLLAAAHDQQMISLGQAKAMNESAQKMSVTLAKAKAAAEGAAAAHAAHPDDDSAFDPEFQQKD
jgi:hypothetical protein